jgi:hypothetical protein
LSYRQINEIVGSGCSENWSRILEEEEIKTWCGPEAVRLPQISRFKLKNGELSP